MTENISTMDYQDIPKRGFGTYRVIENLEMIIRYALSVGYRHFDCALHYENEAQIGSIFEKIFMEREFQREDIFFTGKLWNTYHEDVEKGISTTLRDLKLDYLDLYLVHWPVNIKPDENMNPIRDENNEIIFRKFDIRKLWPQMEQLVVKKKVRAIGVSNFGIENLKTLLSFATIKPFCNQIELHPFLPQKNLIQFCRKNDIIVSSYSSLRSIPDIENRRIGYDLLKLSNEKRIPLSALIINFTLKKADVVITKSSTMERMENNFREIDLNENEMEIIESIKERKRYNEGEKYGRDRFK